MKTKMPLHKKQGCGGGKKKKRFNVGFKLEHDGRFENFISGEVTSLKNRNLFLNKFQTMHTI